MTAVYNLLHDWLSKDTIRVLSADSTISTYLWLVLLGSSYGTNSVRMEGARACSSRKPEKIYLWV